MVHLHNKISFLEFQNSGQRSAEVAVVYRPKDVFGAVEEGDLEA
jgi:hypothetical protein